MAEISQNRALGPINETITLVREEHFAESYSASCLISLEKEKAIYLSIRKQSNSQVDFLKFIVEAQDKGYLRRGDFLVCDNASIHGGLETCTTLFTFLRVCGIEMVYLPAYSPELNPIELVFAQVKRFIRENKQKFKRLPLWSLIALGFAMVTEENIDAYYRKCWVKDQQ